MDHRATAFASTPIGQASPEDASPFNVMDPSRLSKRIARLEADLHECREYLEKQMLDGPAPDKAMQLVCMIDQTLYEPEPRQ